VQYRSVGAIQAHYNTSTLANLMVPLPSLDEQQAILNAIGELNAPLDRAEATAQSEITLLREYRTRLIADVVTGKVDVREAEARLPDALDEAEVEDEEAVEVDLEAEEEQFDDELEEVEV
jgi:type I restriction enzyme, S subunit